MFWGQRITRITRIKPGLARAGFTLAISCLIGVCCLAQQASGPEPFRVQVGGYSYWLTEDLGVWRGMTGEFWYRGNARFVPFFMFDSQTRPEGTRRNYVFSSYLNWTESFYTVQGFGFSPSSGGDILFFPEERYDIKAYWKLPPEQNVVLSGGFTHFDVGEQGYGQIFNAGGLYYRDRWLLEGNVFINRNEPGNLFSGSGSFAAQYGEEGDYWIGFIVGGGKELYRFVHLIPLEAEFTTASANVFYRRWLGRHVGVFSSFEYQKKLDSFQRLGFASSIFFEF